MRRCELAIIIINLVLTCGYKLSSFSNGKVEYDVENVDDIIYDRKWLKNAIRNAVSKEQKENEVADQLPQNGQLFEEDMIMDDELRRAVLGEKSKKAYVKAPSSRRWDSGVVAYEIDKSFLQEGRELLKTAIKEFESRTCIRLKKRTTEKDYVVFSSVQDTCSSFVGKVGGRQVIHLGKDCMVLGTVEHEIMHSLGFVHEHSRPDRDDYIKVRYENINKGEWINFNKYRFDQVDTENTEYNFASVMHYRNDAFTRNGKNTIVAIDDPELRFGQRVQFSIGDIKEINQLYNCKIEPSYEGLYDTKNKQYNRKTLLRRRLVTRLRDILKLLRRKDSSE